MSVLSLKRNGPVDLPELSKGIQLFFFSFKKFTCSCKAATGLRAAQWSSVPLLIWKGLFVFTGPFASRKRSAEEVGAIPAGACTLAEVRGLVD